MRRSFAMAIVAAAALVGSSLIIANVAGTQPSAEPSVSTTAQPTTVVTAPASPDASAAFSASGGSGMVFVDIAPGAERPESAVLNSELIVYGAVVKLDPARFNSPDGKPWRSTTEEDMSMIFETFYVQPEEVLKGSPRFGTPVAFMLMGGTEGIPSSRVKIGEKVLVFGHYNQGVLGNVSWKSDAYWPWLGELGIYRPNGATLASHDSVSGGMELKVTMGQIRDLIANWRPLPCSEDTPQQTK